ncbi:hypothetical protein CKA38_08280 [Ereboglobus luteus]|uniref:Uncharacterized protein n=1 Tax=Ereboglobus luteus TaxID=1796921 RepID=A0A2U8E389_9BACT|nr:hypothetical protein CKA38_08280 [Ereboglobus luteus]
MRNRPVSPEIQSHGLEIVAFVAFATRHRKIYAVIVHENISGAERGSARMANKPASGKNQQDGIPNAKAKMAGTGTRVYSAN